MKKPVIGVTALYDEEKESLWMLPGYFDAVRDAGGLPVMLPLRVGPEDALRACALCDGILFTGGQDVDPGLYGQAARPACGPVSPARDALEKILFEKGFAEDLPMLGICRGLQLMNVLLGGTLYQDLPTEFQGAPAVSHTAGPAGGVACHGVELAADAPLRELAGRERLRVNSYHHQAVRRLAPGLTPMAFAPDGLVEAACCGERSFLWAVQWHPELDHRTQESSALLFRRFVEAAGGGV